MFEELFEANQHYVASFALQSIAPVAAKGFCLVTCMDSRIEPLTMLGLVPGDAKILRNAGGRVTPDVLRSLILATTYLQVTRVAVMHHTLCALANNDEVKVREGFTAEQVENAKDWDFLTMPDADAALTSDVEAVRACPLLPSDLSVEGWRYDVGTGAVNRIISDTQ